MAEKQMTCWQCPRYDRSERRCRDGKANPRSKADSVLVAELLGPRALCHYNLYRDALALRMYFPHHPCAVGVSRRRASRGRRVLVEIEAPEEEREGE
jgi:hypothetical protein